MFEVLTRETFVLCCVVFSSVMCFYFSCVFHPSAMYFFFKGMIHLKIKTIYLPWCCSITWFLVWNTSTVSCLVKLLPWRWRMFYLDYPKHYLKTFHNEQGLNICMHERACSKLSHKSLENICWTNIKYVYWLHILLQLW